MREARLVTTAVELSPAKSRWAVATVGLVVLILSVLMVQIATPEEGAARDFFQDYSSARNLLLGKPVYRPVEQSLREYLGVTARFSGIYNAHPPASVLLVVPFAWTDHRYACMLWSWVSIIALALSLTVLLSELRCRPSTEQWMLMPVGFASWPPLWFHLGPGQFSLVVLLLLTLAWRAGRRGCDAQAGCLIGLAAAIKIFPAVVLLYFAFRRRWRAVVFGMLALLVVNGVTLMVVGTRAYHDYLVFAMPYLAGFSADARNSSLTGFFSRLFNPPLARFLILISSAVILAAIGKTATRKVTDFDSEFALTVTGTLLLCLLTWQHYFVLMLLPLAVCMARFSLASAVWRCGLIGSWILMSVPQEFLPGFSVSGTPSTLLALSVLSINFYGLFGFFIAQTRVPAGPENSNRLTEGRAW